LPSASHKMVWWRNCWTSFFTRPTNPVEMVCWILKKSIVYSYRSRYSLPSALHKIMQSLTNAHSLIIKLHHVAIKAMARKIYNRLYTYHFRDSIYFLVFTVEICNEGFIWMKIYCFVFYIMLTRYSLCILHLFLSI
jgi:hypothetical protein